MAMQLKRPDIKVQRVYVTVRDPDSGDSKSVTLYGVTPEELVELLRREAEDGESAAAQQDPQSAPAPQ